MTLPPPRSGLATIRMEVLRSTKFTHTSTQSFFPDFLISS
jgi:hypothetical protein